MEIYVVKFLSVSFLGSIIANITNKEYELAAKKMIRLGVKGNLVSLAGQLAWYFGTCLYEEEGWNGKKLVSDKKTTSYFLEVVFFEENNHIIISKNTTINSVFIRFSNQLN